MGFPILQQEQILLFTLIFLRIGAMLIMIPVLGERTVPARVKVGLTLLVSLLVFQSVQTVMPNIPADSGFFSMVAAMAGEILIGIIIGFTAKIIFSGIQFAGEMIGMQMGFSIVNVIDPLSSTQVSIFSEFQYLIAALVYLSVDGHHLFILAIVDSYRMVSPFGFHFSGSLMQSIFMFSGVLFTTAVKVSAPVMAILLFTNVALAIVARTVPQINVFIVGFPLQIAAGLLAVGLTVPIFVQLVQRAIAGIGTEVYGLLRLM
jgi:flagellar biosynthetic protein FliR